VDPLLEYIDQVETERDDDPIVVVIPEVVPARWWEKLLHNHSGLILKWALLHKKNVVVCNLRYFLEPFTGPVSFHDEPETNEKAVSEESELQWNLRGGKCAYGNGLAESHRPRKPGAPTAGGSSPLDAPHQQAAKRAAWPLRG
jgi:hypothetical protein